MRYFLAALCLLAPPAFAATGPELIECITTADVSASARHADPHVAITVYRAGQAKAFLAAMLALSTAQPDFDPARIVSLAAYVNSNPHEVVLIYLFDADGCSLWTIAGSREALATTLGHMGKS